MRTPARVSREVLAEFVDEYMQQRTRIRRAGLQKAVIHVHQEEGLPQPVGEEMEAHIDLLSFLLDQERDDPDQMRQFLREMDDEQPESKPVSACSRKSRKRKGKKWNKKRH